MIREICKAEVFLAQKAEAATANDLNSAQDLRICIFFVQA